MLDAHHQAIDLGPPSSGPLTLFLIAQLEQACTVPVDTALA